MDRLGREFLHQGGPWSATQGNMFSQFPSLSMGLTHQPSESLPAHLDFWSKNTSALLSGLR